MPRLVGVGLRSVRRVDAEPDVTHTDAAKERERRAIGRPAKAEPFRPLVAEILAGDPDLLSVEILRRAKLKGYAITALLGALRDMVTQSAPPPMKAALADVIDGIAVKLGGEPIRAAAPSDGSCAGAEQQNGPNGSGTARPAGVGQQ